MLKPSKDLLVRRRFLGQYQPIPPDCVLGRELLFSLLCKWLPRFPVESRVLTFRAVLWIVELGPGVGTSLL